MTAEAHAKSPESGTGTEVANDTAALSDRDPRTVADRYDVLAVLGRGGMGSAYRVRERGTGEEMALKRLDMSAEDKNGAQAIELFEREFHTLNNLAHPRIVRAYDYGVDGGKPYYTMEMLDGGDLREAAPMPWQDACVAAYEVCSALSLLHSRRLVHRDVTPRNVRLTSDGKAKLIDFGLLSPAGPVAGVAGTPPYTAPEALNHLSVDGRSDLFALGATLYFALTGRVAFPARRFENLRDLWRGTPPAPSRLNPEIPAALDTIVLSMMRIDLGSRPKSAAEVMDRLGPLLPSAPDDELTVAGAYLSAPQLVGRDGLVMRARKQVLRALRRRGGGLLIHGDPGTGRSRMLDTFILEAKLLGATAARAGSTDAARGPFGVAQALAEQLHAALHSESLKAAAQDPQTFKVLFGSEESPVLTNLASSTYTRGERQSALRTWLISLAETRPLALAVDDLEMADEPSAALLAALALDADKHRVTYVATLRSASLVDAQPAIEVLSGAAHVAHLEPLSAQDTTVLLRGVFGNVPNLAALSGRLYALCGGKPRDCMALAQHVVDEGAMQYAGGAWSLRDDVANIRLPSNLEQALEVTVESLGPPTKHVGRLLASTALGRLSRAELATLTGARSELDNAIDELHRAQVLAGSTEGYTLCHPSAASLLMRDVSASESAQLHDALASLYDKSQADVLVVAVHLMQGSEPDRGLDLILRNATNTDERVAIVDGTSRLVGDEVPKKALSLAAGLLDAPQVTLIDKVCIWSMLAGLSARGGDADYYHQAPAEWLRLIKRDSGWDAYQELGEEPDHATRAIQAFVKATEAHDARPEEERVLVPADAIRMMVSYVVISIAVGVRTLDLRVLHAQPALLAPLTPLSPVVAAIHSNAKATWQNEGLGQRELARAGFIDVVAQMDAIEGEKTLILLKIRASLCQTISELGAMLGIQPGVEAAEVGSIDPNQRVGAEYVKKVLALHRGDWEAAEAHRQQAELIALQNFSPMFSTLEQELEAHAFARDLTGLRNVRQGVARMAAQYPGWVPVLRAAEAHYHRLCGEPEKTLKVTAKAKLEQAEKTLRSPWLMQIMAVEVSTLVEQGEAETALERANEAIAQCRKNEQRHVARVLAWSAAEAEVALDQHAEARARLEAVLREQQSLGVTGLLLGKTYEHLARLAIKTGDADEFAKASVLVAEQYRPGESSVLGALYERLVEDARRAGVIGGELSLLSGEDIRQDSTGLAHIHTALANCEDEAQRARRALAMLCDGETPREGFLYLLTAQGLFLSACTKDNCQANAELSRFAELQLELERDDEICTMTAADVIDDMDRETGTEFIVIGDDTRYFAVPLRARVEGGIEYLGVALISDNGASANRAMELAPLLTKNFIASGAYRPISVG